MMLFRRLSRMQRAESRSYPAQGSNLDVLRRYVNSESVGGWPVLSRSEGRGMLPQQCSAVTAQSPQISLIFLHALGTEALSADPPAPFCNFQLLSPQPTPRQLAGVRHICTDA